MSTQLTEQQQREVEVDEAVAIESQIRAAKADGIEAGWRLGEALHAFHEVRGWMRLGHETLEEWLAQTEIGLRKSMYFDYVNAWQRLIVERKQDPGRLRALEVTKVAAVLPSITAGDVPVAEALSDVEVLPRRDLREKYAPTKRETSGRPEADKAGDDAQAPDADGSDGALAAGQMPDDDVPGVGDVDAGVEVEPAEQVGEIDATREPAIQPTDEAAAEPIDGAELIRVTFDVARIDQREALAVLQEVQQGIASGADFPRARVASLRVCEMLLDALLGAL